MKVGMRKPSIKKSIKARTTGKIKRQVKSSINPLYGKKGMGWINNPKKAAYNKIYNKTTFGVNDVIRAASGVSSGKKSNTVKKTNYNYNRSSSSIGFKPQYNKEQLKIMLGVEVESGILDAVLAYLGIALIFTGNIFMILIALILEIFVLKTMFSKKFRVANKWYRIIKLYESGKSDKSSRVLRSLPVSESEKESYKKMQEILSDVYSGGINFSIKMDEPLEKENDPLIGKKLLAKEEKIKYSYGIYNEYIVVDTETTGLDAAYDKIIEISAIKYKDGIEIDRFERLINPKIDIPQYITDINHIDNEMVKDKPKIEEVMPEFLEFIKDMPLIAHNAKFDIRFLNANLIYMDKKLNNKIVDTLTISRKIYTDLENHKLTTIKEHLNIDVESHRASSDCLVCGEIYSDYCNTVCKNIDTKNDDELLVYNAVTEILRKNNRELDYFKIRHTATYMDFCALYTFLRVKLNGNKKYILVNLNDNDLMELGLDIEKTSKSENYTNRVKYTSIEDIFKLEAYILNEYDRVIKDISESKNTERLIIDYMLCN